MAKTRGDKTVVDLVLSLAVLMGGVILVVALLPRHHHEAVTPVDTVQPLRAFANQAPFRPLAPAGLPAYWKPTSVRVNVPAGQGGQGADSAPASIRIGYVVDRSSSSRVFARLDESDAPDAATKLLPDGSGVVGSVALADRTPGGHPVPWQVRRDGGGHVALTRAAPGGVTLIVSDGGGKGGAKEPDLEALAASLVPVPAPSLR